MFSEKLKIIVKIHLIYFVNMIMIDINPQSHLLLVIIIAQ